MGAAFLNELPVLLSLEILLGLLGALLRLFPDGFVAVGVRICRFVGIAFRFVGGYAGFPFGVLAFLLKTLNLRLGFGKLCLKP